MQETIKSLARSLQNENNFQEALKEYYYAYKRSTPSDTLSGLLEAQRGLQLSVNEDDFRCVPFPCPLTPTLTRPIVFSFFLRALDRFVHENNNLVPLSGLLPDMTATTDYYVQLQTIFHQKAEQDRSIFRTYLKEELQVSDPYCLSSDLLSLVP